MKKLAILMIVAALAFGQDKAAAPGPAPLAPGEVVRVVEVKNADATNIGDNLRTIFPGISRAGTSLIVRGQPDVVKMIEEAIQKLDVRSPESRPMPNVELTVQLLLGSAQELPDAKVPTDLDAIVRQLRTLFPYKSYRVMDTLVLRSREGRESLSQSGVLPGSQTEFRFGVREIQVSLGGAPRTVTLKYLTASVGRSSGIEGSFDAREGQKTVIGKSNITNSEDAIILVISPKVVE